MPINPAQLRIDAIKVDVAYPEIENFSDISRDSDVVVLVGFCGGDASASDIVPVRYVEQALDAIEARDANGNLISDMGRALMCAWDAGARDIVVLKAGDQSALENLTEDAKAIAIYEALDAAYEVAVSLEWSGTIVPVDVVFEGHRINRTGQELTAGTTYTFPAGTGTAHITKVYDDGVEVDAELWLQLPLRPGFIFDGYTPTGTVTCDWYDFINYTHQLATWCAKSMTLGTPMQGMMSTASDNFYEIVNSDALDEKFAWQAINCRNSAGGWMPTYDDYRFVSVVAGRAHFYLNRFGMAFAYGLAASAAGMQSILPYDVSVAGRFTANAHLDSRFTQDELDKLSFLGIMSFDEPVETRRWNATRIVCMTDQNMSVQASDFQQNVTMRLIRRIAFHVAAYLETLVGTDGSGVNEVIMAAMKGFTDFDYIKGFTYRTQMSPEDPHAMFVLLAVNPYFSAKAIEISLKAGPFNG